MEMGRKLENSWVWAGLRFASRGESKESYDMRGVAAIVPGTLDVMLSFMWLTLLLLESLRESQRLRSDWLLEQSEEPPMDLGRRGVYTPFCTSTVFSLLPRLEWDPRNW